MSNCESCKEMGYDGEPAELVLTDAEGCETYVCGECYHDHDLGQHPDVMSVDELPA